MNKNPEELLRPRIKVKEPWPDMAKSGYHVGQIIELPFREGGQYFHETENPKGKKYEAYYEGYPLLFEKLQWWEHREPNEMPKYVSLYNFSVCKHQICTYESISESPPQHLRDFLPATEQEYIDFLKTQNK